MGASVPDPRLKLVDRVCRIIQESDGSALSLPELARQLHVSVSYLHRTFKHVTGLSPKQYADAKRVAHLRAGLKTKMNVTEAMLNAGYGSSSRLYERAVDHLGMTPRTYQCGAPNTHVRYTIGDCHLGQILLAATDKGICMISMGDEESTLIACLAQEFPHATIDRDDQRLQIMLQAVLDHLAGSLPHPDLPLDVHGTAFQRRVWAELQRIPHGETRTYAEVAERLGIPRAVRAVARACATNPVSILTPCHRVVGSDGSLRGYRWGLARKQKLLELERERKKESKIN